MACGAKLTIGLSPSRFYAEAAHVRPLGKPHNGPDSPMIILCPNHHLQFDRGIISLRPRAGIPVFVSRIAGVPITASPCHFTQSLPWIRRISSGIARLF